MKNLSSVGNFRQRGFTSVEVAFVLIGLASIAAWVTHVVTTIKAGAYLLLLAGGLIPPIGVIHGVMIWLGQGWV